MSRHYTEENSTFASDGKTYNLSTLFLLTRETPIQEIEVSKLTWVLAYDRPRPDRVHRADLSAPIMVTTYKGQELVIDGLHRLQKAVNENKKTLPYKRVSDEMLAMAEMKKQSK